MKHSTTIWFLLTAMTSAAPVLHTDDRVLTPESKVRISFDQPMVPDNRVGTTVANNILEVEPAMEGRILWVQTTIAEFQPAAPPLIGAKHDFSLRNGLTHLDGTPVPAGPIGSAAAEAFHYETSMRRGPTRQPVIFLRFNDAVRPGKLGKHLYFKDREGNRVAGKASRSDWAELQSTRFLGPTWEQRLEGWETPEEAALDPKTRFPNIVAVRPVRPLPIGNRWYLHLSQDLPNASGTARTIRESRWGIGSVIPFKVSYARAATVVDVPRHLTIHLSKPLSGEIDVEALAPHIRIEPSPGNRKLHVSKSRTTITVSGDFAARATWNVAVDGELSSDDGLALAEPFEEALTFKHLPPGVGLPSEDESQLAGGSRDYPIDVLNMESVRIRIKELAGRNAVRAMQGYRHYKGHATNGKSLTPRHPLPFELINGTVVHDKVYRCENPIDTSRQIRLDWDSLLDGRDHATLFLTIEGTPRREFKELRNKSRISQSLIQLTDIGLAWKLTDEEAFIYAYSCDTGRPLDGVELDVFTEDARRTRTVRTTADGTARLPRTTENRHLRARLDDDSVLIAFDDRLPTVSMWRFPVRHSWSSLPTSRRTASLFSERSLYRPGETVHLKGIVRHLVGGDVSARTDPPATLRVRDNQDRIVAEATIDHPGSFDHSFILPPETVGRYRIELSWPEELDAASASHSWWQRWAASRQAKFTHSINVQEFRRNSFEVQAEVALEDPATVLLSTTASYYQGPPLDGAEANWYLRVQKRGFYPDQFRDFYFCDHRTYDPHYWSHYFGYDDDRYYSSASHGEHGWTTLGPGGSWQQRHTLPEQDFPAPRMVSLTSEVTDPRDQTLSGRASLLVHSSGTYLGIGRLDRLMRVGEQTSLKFVAVAADGLPATGPQDATLTIAREVHEQVKTRGADGAVVVRNEMRIERILERPVTIRPEDTGANGLVVPFTPTGSGKHVFTLSGTDASGRSMRTVTVHHVYGSREFPWAYEEDMRIKLVPERKDYKPGDTARILVLTPIEGTALVTVERENVSRHFIRELKSDEPLIEIPLEGADTPNAFISVLVVKGSRDNLREHKEPILRLGFCELLVDPVQKRLAVHLETPGDYHRPGAEVVLSGRVTDHRGRPVAGAEVTLYAEDEGTLAVMGYRNPDPFAHFYAPRDLVTRSGTSLGNFISEDPENRNYLANKGFFVGGGDDLSADGGAPKPRENFDPCAVWKPALVTDSTGRVRVSFKAPDTLTRYRLIAVAQDEWRFGSGEGEFVVDKPLMLEPAVPRFAHEGDRLQPKVLVQNTTPREGTWRITLQLDSHASFAEGIEREQSRVITLGPASSLTVPFDVRFRETGTSRWTWRAVPVAVGEGKLTASLRDELSDAVTSRLEVAYPMPLLRENKLIRFEGSGREHDLLHGLSPELLAGRGELELEFGRSLLLEAGGAFDFLLQYPYGCVEQTSSATIAWIAAGRLRGSIPAFASHSDSQVKEAIQSGANRLLSMQTRDGGLSYWPGDDRSSTWASCYGGMTLIMCRQAGAAVPRESVERLTAYLAGSLRKNEKEERDWWDWETVARTCYSLALAGQAEEPYHNLLLDRLESLPANALPFLALAIRTAGGDDAEATAMRVLQTEPRTQDRRGHWMPFHPDHAYTLLALANIAPDSERCALVLDRILETRSPRGHWRTTWCNAWSLLAMGTYAEATERPDEAVHLALTTDEGTREIVLDSAHPSETVRIRLHRGMRVSATGLEGAIARVKLAAKPSLAPVQAVARNGLKIARSYHRVHHDGSETPMDVPEVGDLLRVELQVTLPRDDARYLVVEDPLPAICEAVNTEFVTQAGRIAGRGPNGWEVSHQELRDDRAVFFVNRCHHRGTYEISYHARVTSAGQAAVPPAKVEAMYDPRFFALSASTTLRTPAPAMTSGR
jgi:uncharacterized protein YfaS (alpha-2-macroglobulin family)